MRLGHNRFTLNQRVTIMKKFFNYIKSILKVNSSKKEVVNCNYSNNYYGDQYCQTSIK